MYISFFQFCQYILLFSVFTATPVLSLLLCCFVFVDNMGEDCPVFENLFEFCQIYAGGTIGRCNISSQNMLFLVLIYVRRPNGDVIL
jgi:hypothetical protein